MFVAQLVAELFERRQAEPAMFFQAVFRACLHLVEIPSRFGHANDRHVQVAALDHGLQRGENLLVGQVSCRAEENQSVGLNRPIAESIE